jgi:hypothetical protein
MVLSIGIFFSLMIVGLSNTLPQTMQARLVEQQVPAAIAHQVASEPPVASLFAAFLGYNPMAKLIPADVLAALPAENAATITGKAFFPELLSRPFMHGLLFAFGFSMLLNLIAAYASWQGGVKFIHIDAEEVAVPQEAPAE